MERTVTLPEMAGARERRVARRSALTERYRSPLICFTMNIAGPVKDSPLIRRGFSLGRTRLLHALRRERLRVLHSEASSSVTGNETFLVVNAPARKLAEIAAEIEESPDLGQLFDMDVADSAGVRIGRSAPRPCLICGRPGGVCARNRAHTVAELQARTAAILRAAVTAADAKAAASLAARALMYELATTPKPGLVDRNNSGSHRDMDFFTFLDSTAALWPYFERCAEIGAQTAEQPACETFARLRPAGKAAEGDMLAATRGVNTHKGAVFSMGLACAAFGRLAPEERRQPARLLAECAAMTAGITARDFKDVTAENASTFGQKLWAACGITGVRGQAEAGFPAVLTAGLPTLERGTELGYSLNRSGCAALLALTANAVDTNMISRGGKAEQERCAAAAAELLERAPYPAEADLAALDREYTEKNLSPGGSADLLALSYFLYFAKHEEENECLTTA